MLRKKILLCMIHSMSARRMPFPVGAAFISAVLKNNFFDVANFVWNLDIDDEENRNNLETEIKNNNIDVLMCSGYIYNYRTLKQIFYISKNSSPEIITIQGGGFCNYSPVESMELMPECDIGVIGEGEITICELMHAIESGKDIDSVKSIIYRCDGGQIIFTEKRIEKPDLATLPIPDYEGFFGNWLNGHLSFFVSSGRCCNFKCTFCSMLDGRHRSRPLEKIFEELDYYTAKYDIKRINFANEYFNTDEDYLNYFCERIKLYGIPVEFVTRISDKLTVPVLEKLKNAGVDEIFFGLESADNTVLKSMRKGITEELIKEVLTNAKKARINANGNFIFGDVAENTYTIKKTLEFARNHRDLYQVLSLVMIQLLPGSFLYDKAVSEGRINPIEHIDNSCPYINISGLSDEEYLFYRDGYLTHFLVNEIESDLNIENVIFKRVCNSSIFDFNFQCASCRKEHNLLVDTKELTYYDCKIFCECGEKIALDFITHIIDRDKIYSLIHNYKTGFYGLGRIFYKIYYKCEISSCEDSVFFINGNYKTHRLQSDISNRVLSPRAISEEAIDKVIITIGASFDTDTVISELKEKYPGTDFVMWYDI